MSGILCDRIHSFSESMWSINIFQLLLPSEDNVLIQLILLVLSNEKIPGIFIPPSLILPITVSLLTLGVLPFQRKLNISLSIFCKVKSGTNKTDSKYDTYDMIEDFIRVTFPFKDSFLCGHMFINVFIFLIVSSSIFDI